MADVQAKPKIKEQTIHAVVTRADGTVEDLGMVSYYSDNPVKRWAWRLRKFFRELLT